MSAIFTTQHYRKIAEIIRSHEVDPNHCDKCEAKDTTMRLVAYDFAEMFEQDNPRFKRDTFYTACGFARPVAERN